jgi:hypothetical protein
MTIVGISTGLGARQIVVRKKKDATLPIQNVGGNNISHKICSSKLPINQGMSITKGYLINVSPRSCQNNLIKIRA